MSRTELDNRRPAYAFQITDSGGTPYRLAVSFQDEKVKEIWISGGGKVGTEKLSPIQESTMPMKRNCCSISKPMDFD